MNTKQIDYILQIIETQNFNKAAENLFISQPTLSYQIKLVENEIGFPIFNRNGKGVTLTPAGEQFVITLKEIRFQLKNAIEMGQNFSSTYSENIRICMPTRSTLILLPEAIKAFNKKYPTITVTPIFDLYHGIDLFMKGDVDILFINEDDVRHIPDINITPIYRCHYYFVCNNNDPYASKKIIHEDDLKDRTLLVNGGSGKMLRKIQQRVISHTGCKYFNSENHDTTLTYIASNKAIVISPGSLNDHTGAFTWIPFDCKESFNYSIITHTNDTRWSLNNFIETIKETYKKTKLPL